MRRDCAGIAPVLRLMFRLKKRQKHAESFAFSKQIATLVDQ